MDETRLDYTHKMLDDHEQRIRNLEQNNKLEVRVEVLEQYMKGEIAVCGKTKEGVTERRESRSDIYAIIGMIISVATFFILVWKLA